MSKFRRNITARELASEIVPDVTGAYSELFDMSFYLDALRQIDAGELDNDSITFDGLITNSDEFIYFQTCCTGLFLKEEVDVSSMNISQEVLNACDDETGFFESVDYDFLESVIKRKIENELKEGEELSEEEEEKLTALLAQIVDYMMEERYYAQWIKTFKDRINITYKPDFEHPRALKGSKEEDMSLDEGTRWW